MNPIWTQEDADRLYQISHWGKGYFSVGEQGTLCVHPDRNTKHRIDLKRVADAAQEQGLGFPLVVRFQDILRDRVVLLNETFARVIAEAGYKGQYQGVYPIKVNQMREVVEEIIDAGTPFRYGLESGSKAELAAVAAMDLPEGALVICNGYKDYGYIKTALIARQLGKRVVIVVEKLSELYQVIQVSRELGVSPEVGVRVRLYAKGSGQWESSGGEFAKFGLTTPELVHAFELLKKEGMESALKLVHFHIGSQVTNIRRIKDAVKESMRFFCKLKKEGADLEFIDVGGGLGVDYDGSQTDFKSSTNYSLNEYVADIVYSIQEVCSAEGVDEPTIVTESGRFVVAHHSVLLVNVFGSIEVGATPFAVESQAEPGEHRIVDEMRFLLESVSKKNFLEMHHDALERKEEAISLFNHGLFSLRDRAKVEHLYWQVARKILRASEGQKYVPEEIERLRSPLADQYLCNFSVFQSMLDHWAIDALFPVLPIHRLLERPEREGVLVDITCDSDGKVDQFIDLRDIKSTLSLHSLKQGESYILGFFLLGAYQDIMGDHHNLFGRVNEVHVFADEEEADGFYLEECIRGAKISDVLLFTQYHRETLIKSLKAQMDRAVKQGTLRAKDSARHLDFYESMLDGYTYIENKS